MTCYCWTLYVHTLRAGACMCYYPAMGNLQSNIQQKQKEMEGHRNDLFSLYADLGKSVALIEQITPLGFGNAEFKQFIEVQSRYDEAELTYERLKGYISQLEDRSRKIKEIEADIRSLHKVRGNLFARLGAIAYEAYGSQTLPEYLIEVCAPYFEEHHVKTRKLEEACASDKNKSYGFLRKYSASFILNRHKKRLLPRLVQAGSALVSIGCEADIPGIGKEKLSSELSSFLKKEKALQQELDIHRSAVVKLRTQEKESPKGQLELSRVQFNQIGKERDKIAFLYGKVLYDTLPESVSSEMVGSRAITLIDQISLHLRRLDRLEQDILELQNMMKVEELEAQIELENQKIEHLHSQIEGCNRQIKQVQLSIEAKRSKIVALQPQQALPYNE